MSGVSLAVLLVAIISNGLLAGLYGAFAIGICPALRYADDNTVVTVFRMANRQIVNPLFLAVFFGAPASAVAAVVVIPRTGLGESTLPWAVAGAAGAVASLLITMFGNVPLNDRLERAEICTREALATARRAFERPWSRWNMVRAVASTGASIGLAVDLTAL